jgi:hypothetical protein
MAYPQPVNYYYMMMQSGMLDNITDMQMAATPARNNPAVASGQVAQPAAMKQLMTGKNASGVDIGAAATGLASMVGNTIGMANQGLNLGQMGGIQISATGDAVLDNSYRNMATIAKPRGATGGELASSTLSGAASGFATAGPIGAAVGAGLGLLTTAIGGAARKRKQRRERNEALEASARQQQEFNQLSDMYDQGNIARTQYQDRMNMTNRITNLYSV